ncbi:MAG: hypothetical protein KF791_03420 [Verrucomicrobiae bacterium]|nr:hypothetical protein [Verrucomicrobiae bacterium]
MNVPHPRLRPDCGSGPDGFTLVELLSLLSLLAVLLTLGLALFANARVRRQQMVCMDNLRLVARAVHEFEGDPGKRPRSFTRVMTALPSGIQPANFLCPSDPALRGAADRLRATNTYWGNQANASQEPWTQTDLREPESGSWSAEMAEIKETEPFSYLHPLGWRRPAWQRLVGTGRDFGLVVCQLHGVRVPPAPIWQGFKPYLQYEGEMFRGTDDGAVLKRKVFRPGATADGPPGTDYPWEFYTDVVPGQSR